MKTVTIKGADGRLVEVPVSDEVYESLISAERTAATKRRIDRARLVREELDDYHTRILLFPPRAMSDMVEDKLLIEQMLRCLGTLSDFEQLLIHKRFYEGLSFESIAKDVGVSHQSIQKRVTRIIKRLSAMMGGCGE